MLNTLVRQKDHKQSRERDREVEEIERERRERLESSFKYD